MPRGSLRSVIPSSTSRWAKPRVTSMPQEPKPSAGLTSRAKFDSGSILRFPSFVTRVFHCTASIVWHTWHTRCCHGRFSSISAFPVPELASPTYVPTNQPTFDRTPADYAPCSPVMRPTRTALRRACAIELASTAADMAGCASISTNNASGVQKSRHPDLFPQLCLPAFSVVLPGSSWRQAGKIERECNGMNNSATSC